MTLPSRTPPEFPQRINNSPCAQTFWGQKQYSQCLEAPSQNEEKIIIKSELMWVTVMHFTVMQRKLPPWCCYLCSARWVTTRSSCHGCTNEQFDRLHWSKPCLYYIRTSSTRNINCLTNQYFISNTFCLFRIFYANINANLIGRYLNAQELGISGFTVGKLDICYKFYYSYLKHTCSLPQISHLNLFHGSWRCTVLRNCLCSIWAFKGLNEEN